MAAVIRPVGWPVKVIDESLLDFKPGTFTLIGGLTAQNSPLVIYVKRPSKALSYDGAFVTYVYRVLCATLVL